MKNVHDGISRPLGSQEIQKTKVLTVLPDTLYDIFGWNSQKQSPNSPNLLKTSKEYAPNKILKWKLECYMNCIEADMILSGQPIEVDSTLAWGNITPLCQPLLSNNNNYLYVSYIYTNLIF